MSSSRKKAVSIAIITLIRVDLDHSDLEAAMMETCIGAAATSARLLELRVLILLCYW